MSQRLNKFEATAVWLDGVNLIGHISEFEMPELEWNMSEHETIGLMGISEYPRKMSPLEATITWADYSPELAAAAANPYQPVSLQLRSNFGVYTGSSKEGDILHKVALVARFKTNALGTFSSDEFERESTLAVDYVKESWDGVDVVEFGVNPPILRISAQGSNLGTDVFAGLRSNLGI